MLSARARMKASGRERSATEPTPPPGKLRLGASWIEDQVVERPQQPKAAMSRRESSYGSVKDLGGMLSRQSTRASSPTHVGRRHTPSSHPSRSQI